MVSKYTFKNGVLIDNPEYGKSLTKRFFETVTPKLSKQWDESEERKRQEEEQQRQVFKYYIRPVSLSKEMYDKCSKNENIKISINENEPYNFEIQWNYYATDDIKEIEITDNRLSEVFSNKYINFTDVKSLKANMSILKYKGILFLYDHDTQICRVLPEINTFYPASRVKNLYEIVEFIEREALRITDKIEAEKFVDELPF